MGATPYHVGPPVLRPERPASARAETAITYTSPEMPLCGNTIPISYENGSAICVASSQRRIHDGPSVVRGRLPTETILDAALTSVLASVPGNESGAWFWLIGRSRPLQSAYPSGA